MSLEHILLGMLRTACSGYDLKQEFELGARHFWSAELSQIYPTLKRMESKGWLESRLEPSPRGPDRRVYERTAAGREVLHEWLRSGPAIGSERFAYIGQIIYMGELDDLDATLEFLQQLREELEAILSLLRGAHEGVVAEERERVLSVEEFHERLSLGMGVKSLQAKVDWCDESIALVEKRIEKSKGTKK